MAGKQAIREHVWELLQRERAARFPGAQGRIPNFRGAEAAASRLASLTEWAGARVIKANPDAPQLPARRQARRDGKVLYMAVPRLASEHPFVLVQGDPTIKRGISEGRPLGLDELEPIDLVLCGSVAVNRHGVRIGKGGGFSDLELALLIERRLIAEQTTIVTTVHPLQLLDEDLPETEHDFRVDLIVMPDEVIQIPSGARKRSPGILWDHLDEETRAAIPVLSA